MCNIYMVENIQQESEPNPQHVVGSEELCGLNSEILMKGGKP